jgi:DNA replication protein DnaC
MLIRVSRIKLLIIDDWGFSPLADKERRILLDILEDRYDISSTLISSQFPIEKWHDNIGDPTVADAICDRLIHNAHRIKLTGESMRKKYSDL